MVYHRPIAFEHRVLRTNLRNVSKQYYFNHNTLFYNLIHVKLPPKPGT